MGDAREKLREEMDRERKKSKKVDRIVMASTIMIAVLLIVGVVAAVAHFHKGDVHATENLTPKFITVDGAYHLTPDGSVDTKWVKENPLNNKKRVEIFMDPQCPGCRAVDSGLDTKIREWNKAGKIDLSINVVSFLDDSSTDQYSSRAANALVTVAENEPKKFQDFMAELFRNQPKEGIEYRPISDEDLGDWAKNVGVSDKTTSLFKDHLYQDWVLKHTDIETHRSDFFPKKFATPAVFVGGHMDDKGFVTGAQEVVFHGPDSIVEDFAQAAELS